MMSKLKPSLNMNDVCCDSVNQKCNCKPSKRGYNLEDLFIVAGEYAGGMPMEFSTDFDLQYCLNYEKVTKTAHLLNMALGIVNDAEPFIVAIIDKDGNLDNLWEDLEL
jgi:hypothetical protein